MPLHDQLLEQLERFRLVLVERIALRHAAPADDLAQVVERDEVFAPQVVERLQDHLLLDVAHRLWRVALDAFGVGLVGGLEQALGHFLVADAFLLRPRLDRKVEVELGGDLFLEAGDVPRFRIGVGRDVAGDEIVDDVGAHVGDRRLERLLRHHLAPVLEDDLALVVHHVVELEDVLADVEVARFDLLLRFLQRLVDPRVDDRLVVLQAQPLQHRVHALGAEDAHQVVLQRQVELGAAGVALAARAAAQLVVDAAALVPLGAHDVEAARLDRLLLEDFDLGADLGLLGVALLLRGLRVELLLDAHLDVAAELNVGAAAGHVGGDGDRAGNAGFGDDERFLLVVASVEDGEVFRRLADPRRRVKRGHCVGSGEVDLLVAAAFEHLGQMFRLLDRRRADQHRLHLGVGFLDLAHHRAQLLVVGAIDLVVLVEAVDRHVGRNLDDDQLVDLGELVGFGRGGAGHAGELLVEAEIVLEGDRGEGDVFRLDGDVLLRLQRLVQAFRIAAAGHHAAGELVDDHDFAVADDVVLVDLEQLVGAQRLIDVVDEGGVGGFVEEAFLHQPAPRSNASTCSLPVSVRLTERCFSSMS